MPFIALQLHRAKMTVTDHYANDKYTIQTTLPDGCIGLLLCFETRQDAINYFGFNVNTREVVFEEG
jgi:hypothetical protein